MHDVVPYMKPNFTNYFWVNGYHGNMKITINHPEIILEIIRHTPGRPMEITSINGVTNLQILASGLDMFDDDGDPCNEKPYDLVDLCFNDSTIPYGIERSTLIYIIQVIEQYISKLPNNSNLKVA